MFSGSVPAIIEEDVRDQPARAFRFTAGLLDRIDLVGRATDVLPSAALLSGGGIPGRTRAEHQASPNFAAFNPFANQQAFVTLDPIASSG